MQKVWKEHGSVIPDVLKSIRDDCNAWKLVRLEGATRFSVISGCLLLRNGFDDKFFASSDGERDSSWLINTRLDETELKLLIEKSLGFRLFGFRHLLISFEKAWQSSLLAHDPDCTIYARYEGNDVLVISL